ncbi:MAG: hypothetical protein RH862_12045 [Leptospiraceae bacterium]
MKRIQLVLAVLIFGSLTATQAEESPNSWFGLRISQASWEPAAFNELDKLRQTGLQNSSLFSGSLLAVPADYFDYGQARQSMPMVELIISIGGANNRGNINLGYAGTGSAKLDAKGLSYLYSQTFNIISQTNSNQFSIFQKSELKHFELGYDHELYLFRDQSSVLKDVGFILGLQLARDEFFADQYNTGFTQVDSGTSGSITSSSISQINSTGSTEHNITTADLHFGLIYRKQFAEKLEFEAGASFGAGKGQSTAIISSLSLLTLGSSTFPLETSSEYTSDGDLRTSRFHLGLGYLINESVSIKLHYGTENRYYTPTSGSIKAGGLVTIENPVSGPFYTQKDKLSTIGLEFQARF